jgi:hypothetical protein
MGGVGSGRRLDGEPRRLVERCFVLNVERVLEAGREPGTLSDIEIRASLIVWPVRAIVLIRRTDTLVATVLFEGLFGGGLDHLPIEIAEQGSHRRAYFLCPRSEHASRPRRSSKLYWPAGDERGFACRDCHRLAYWTSQSRHLSPLHLARAVSDAYWDDQARAVLARAEARQRRIDAATAPAFSWRRRSPLCR